MVIVRIFFIKIKTNGNSMGSPLKNLFKFLGLDVFSPWTKNHHSLYTSSNSFKSCSWLCCLNALFNLKTNGNATLLRGQCTNKQKIEFFSVYSKIDRSSVGVSNSTKLCYLFTTLNCRRRNSSETKNAIATYLFSLCACFVRCSLHRIFVSVQITIDTSFPHMF